MTVDSDRSSGLVAVHLACQSLRRGESSLAIVGAANLVLSPKPSIAFSRAGMLAAMAAASSRRAGPTASCAARALPRSSSSRWLRPKPMGTPSTRSSVAAPSITAASASRSDDAESGSAGGAAGATPTAMPEFRRRASNYVEAHGPGTPVGDPIEVSALGGVLCADRATDRPLSIGSVKTNIGHTEAAAGLAGLIKVALALKQGQLPPSPCTSRYPTPTIPFAELALSVQRAARSVAALRRAARGGRERLRLHRHQRARGARSTARSCDDGRRRPRGGLASGSTASVPATPLGAQRSGARRHRDEVPGPVAEPHRCPALADLCSTASLRRCHHRHRLSVVAGSITELASSLEALARGDEAQGRTAPSAWTNGRGSSSSIRGRARSGSAWGDSSRARSPSFAALSSAATWRCGNGSTGRWFDELDADEGRSRLHQLDVVQPTLIAVYLALSELWRSLASRPMR